jgi:hypothetical protein
MLFGELLLNPGNTTQSAGIGSAPSSLHFQVYYYEQEEYFSFRRKTRIPSKPLSVLVGGSPFGFRFYS